MAFVMIAKGQLWSDENSWQLRQCRVAEVVDLLPGPDCSTNKSVNWYQTLADWIDGDNAVDILDEVKQSRNKSHAPTAALSEPAEAKSRLSLNTRAIDRSPVRR